VPLCVFNINLNRGKCTCLCKGIYEVRFELEHEVEEAGIPHLNKHGFIDCLCHIDYKLFIRLIKVSGKSDSNLEIINMDSNVFKHIDTEVILLLKLVHSLVHICAESMHIRHGESSKPSQAHKFSPLFLPETVAGHFNHPKRQVPVGNCHVVIHKELPETGCKTQKHLPFVGLDGVLSCRESVKIFFQGWVVHIVHERSF